MNDRMRMKRRANRRLPDLYQRLEIILVIIDERGKVEKAYDLWDVVPKFDSSHDVVLAYRCNSLIPDKNYRRYSQDVLQKSFEEWSRKTISSASESDNEEEAVER